MKHPNNSTVLLITFAKVPEAFTKWLDQLYSDDWYIKFGQWTDKPEKITKIYTYRPVDREHFETLARIKFPELF